MTETIEDPHKPQPDRLTRILRVVVFGLLAFAVVAAGIFAYMYAVTPEGLRRPGSAHYHFRMQVLDEGKPVDFTQDDFQTAFDKDMCNADLTKEPVHFHDKLDQYVHVHWTGVTGGVLLKNYGWNVLGGTDGTLGYRFDQFPKVTRIPAHGSALPQVSPDSEYFIYTGDTSGYKKRDLNEFIDSELQDFFSGSAQTSWLERIVPSALAHGTEAQHAEEELAELNNLVGNVVIFVQAEEPTDAQIKDRFTKLIELPESSCAG